jgi:hypothetical protein
MPQVASVAVRTHAGWLGGGPFKVVGQDATHNSSASGHPWRIISLISSAQPLRLLARLAVFYQRPQRLVDVPEAGAGCLTPTPGAVVFMLLVWERVS